MKIKYILWAAISLLLISGCGTSNKKDKEAATQKQDIPIKKRSYEAISLLGDTLYAMDIPADIKKQYDSALQVAQNNYQQNPHKLNNIIWLGRRLAYLSRYREAIRIYTEGIQLYPDSPELYRHRGHCYIITRMFDKAVIDLEKSAILSEDMPVTLESDGLSMLLSKKQRHSTLQFNIWYHLGLAYYLTGAYGKAAQAYEESLSFAEYDDEIAASADWLYMTYRRLGEDEVAEKTLDMIREDIFMHQEGYFERLLMYKGLLEPDSLLKQDINPLPAEQNLYIVTNSYGTGNYYMANGEKNKGEKLFRKTLNSKYWAALDYIAAETDLATISQEKHKE